MDAVGALDLRTVFVTYVSVLGLCVLVMVLVWRQNRDRYPELACWVAAFAAFFVSNVLIVLRGAISDWLTVVVANTIMLAGMILLLEGLSRFYSVKSHWKRNLLYLGIFAAVHALFTFAIPSLPVRAVNWAVGISVMLAQSIWLITRRAPRSGGSAERVTVLVLQALFVLTIVYAARDFFTSSNDDLFSYGIFSASVFLTYEFLFLSLAFALVMLVSGRLHDELREDALQRGALAVELDRQKRFFSVAFESLPDPIAIGILPERRVVEVNQAFVDKFGYDREEAVGRTVMELGIWADTSDREEFIARMSQEGRCRAVEAELLTRTGARFSAEVSGEIMENEGKRWSLVVFHDVTERKQAENKWYELATRDPLTSLLNHRGLFEATETIAASPAEGRLVLAYLDLDGLKEVNDRYGHLLGDQALIAFANVLQEAFRTADVVSRIGGDEFVVVAVCRGDDASEAIRRRLSEALADYNQRSQLPFPLKVSMGVVECDRTEIRTQFQLMMSRADALMYDEKRLKSVVGE